MLFNKDKRTNGNWKNKIKDKKDLIELGISFIALLVSIWAILTSTRTQKEVANYEFLLSQTPNICILNQEFQIPFEINFDVENTDFGGYKGIINLATIEDNDFPIKIPIYNIGVGIAQNCKVIWSAQNQKEVIL